MEVLPQACSKKRVSSAINVGTLSLSPGSYIVYDDESLSHFFLVIGDLKLYFGGRFVV